jgi:hypothetical protein
LFTLFGPVSLCRSSRVHHWLDTTHISSTLVEAPVATLRRVLDPKMKIPAPADLDRKQVRS